MTELFGRDKLAGGVGVDDSQDEDSGREVKVTRACPLRLQTAFSSPASEVPHGSLTFSLWLSSFPASPS